MKPDDLENQLRRQPFRPVPDDWRDEILGAARAAATSGSHSRIENQRSKIRATWFRAIFWPNPAAWAGLAAAWVLVFALNNASVEPAQRMAGKPAAAPADIFMAMLRQQQELARLIEPSDTQPAEPPKSPPRPRSELKNRITLA